jgi:hypothetical protein
VGRRASDTAGETTKHDSRYDTELLKNAAVGSSNLKKGNENNMLVASQRFGCVIIDFVLSE